jgi:hypothetical protein
MGRICLALGLHAWGECIPFVLFVVKYCLLFWKENVNVQVFEKCSRKECCNEKPVIYATGLLLLG